MSKRSVVFLVFLIIASLPALRALSIPGFYTSHDGLTHTARIANYYLALTEGQIPPRLAPRLFGGLGFPMFVFIYPLPYLLGSLIHALSFSFTSAFEIVIGASFLFSAIAMFLFLRELLGELAGFVGALFYSWAPYRFSQLYVRAAIAESLAYVFVPLVLFAMLKLARTLNRRWIAVTALSLAGLLLSHQLVSLMFLPVLVVFAWFFARESKKPHRYLASSFLAATLGLAIAAFIYLPSLFERRFLRFDELINYYQDHFVTLSQLIHSPWSYGFSMAGTAGDDMSFQVGLTHLVVVSGATIVVFQMMSKIKRTKPESLFGFGIISLGVFAVSILLMLELPIVRTIWRNVPGLAILDFPWRLLGVSVFAASLLAAWLIKVLENHPVRFLFFPFLLFFVFYANRNHLRINQTVVLNDEFFLGYAETATWQNEFLPIWRVTNKLTPHEDDVMVVEGEILSTELVNKTHELRLALRSSTGGRLQLQRLYFPGWEVSLDGRLLTLDGDLSVSRDIQLETATQPFADRSGLLELRIPPGEHQVEARFRETPIRRVGFGLSALGLISTVAIAVSQQGLRSKR